MNVYIKSIRFKTDKGLEEFINKKMQKSANFTKELSEVMLL